MKVNTTYEPYSQEPEYIEANRALLTHLPLERVHKVLDLACGTGLLTDLLLQMKPGLDVIGIDISAESLDIARAMFREKGVLVEYGTAEAARPNGGGRVVLIEGSADDLPFPPASFDLVMIGNAIHLMPDKDRFLQAVSRVLIPGGSFTFNSVFYSGTFPPGSEAIYAEWMKEAVLELNKRNEALRKAGKSAIPRVRGKSGRAFDKGWLSAERWQAKLEEHGLRVTRNYDHPTTISQRGLELVGAYGGLAEVLMSGYPVEIASECLQVAVGRAFTTFGVHEVPRNWLEITAVKI
jgi:ubiquinone/menaquinone biosynthesis C-methylase UbiE